MNRPRLILLTGFGSLLLAIGTTTTLRARQGGERLADFMPSGPPNVFHVDAPPRTVPETKTWLKLQAIVPVNFPDGTSLQDLVKFVRESTRDVGNGLPRGIPIYVDPQGLNDVDKTMASTVTIDLDGIPLGKALRLAVQTLGMVVELDKDGLVTITSGGCNDGMPVSFESANWQALDGLREDIQALRAEVTALRQSLKHETDNPMAPKTLTPGPAGGQGGGLR